MYRLLWKQTKCKGNNWYHRIQVLLLLTNINKDLSGLVIVVCFLSNQRAKSATNILFPFPIEPNVHVSPYCPLNIGTCMSVYLLHYGHFNIRRDQLQF